MRNVFDKCVYYIYDIIIICLVAAVVGAVDIVETVITPSITARFF